MAETPLKRQREETQMEEVEENKRHKSLNHILSLLEEEEDISTQDLSLLMTTLQEELSSDSTSDPVDGQTAVASDEYEHEVQSENDFTSLPPPPPPPLSSSSSCDDVKQVEEEEEDKEREFRHLLEASDDELGIPPSRDESENQGCLFNENEELYCNDGLWEFDDEVAVAEYALMQSEFFM